MKGLWKSFAMEKQPSNSGPSERPEVDDLKLQPEPSVVRDVDVGHMLEVDASPEQERKVLWKLDMM